MDFFVRIAEEWGVIRFGPVFVIWIYLIYYVWSAEKRFKKIEKHLGIEKEDKK